MNKSYLLLSTSAVFLVLSYIVFAMVGPSGGSSPPPDKCGGVVCQEVSKVCNDGFIDKCSPACNSASGICGICTPDCKGHEGPNIEAKFKCGELTSSRERIKCRINLPYENELNYLPEECRGLTGIYKAGCVTTYQIVHHCFFLKNDVARVECAKKELVLSSIAEEKGKCAGNSTCIQELQTKVFDLVKFRIYNLEQKAQELKEKGVDENLVLDFITSAEAKKMEFNNAQTIAEKKQVVNGVIKLWLDFVSQAKKQVK